MKDKGNNENSLKKINRQHIIISPKNDVIKFLITKIKTIMKKFKLIYLISIVAVATTITSCKKIDPAPPQNSVPVCTIECKNGGTVNASCGCDCPQGFTGANCGTALALKSVTVTRIIVNNFPRTKNSGQLANLWDPTPGTIPARYPDIYINIKKGISSSSSQTSAIYMNVNSVPQTYALVPVTLADPSNYYTISLYNYNGLSVAPELMGGIYLIPADFKNGNPQTIHLSNSALHIDYTVYLIWNY